MKANIMKKTLGLILLLCAFSCLMACDNIFPPKENPTEINGELKINGVLLARVNNWAIGLDDFKNYLKSLEPLAKTQKIDINNAEFKVKFLNDLIKNQILAQIAVSKGLDKSDDVLRALRDTRDTLLAAKVRDDLERNISVSYAEVKAFYDKNKELFKKPQEVKVREIVVNSEFTAKEAMVKILQGENFDSLARQYSTASSKDRGGDRGWLTPTPEDVRKNTKFWATVATLGKDDLPKLFKDDDGKFYIIKVDDIRGGQEVSLSEVEKDLEKALKADKVEQEENKVIDEFKRKARVEKSEDLLK
ncbi:MAG: peptidyl-prolyl cis-trans isomerase [Candidatus Omnitrophota bacterium]|jgi:peptidyl-prolyl cis-trans isomerase C